MGHKHQFTRPITDSFKLLFDFGNVLMSEWLVRIERRHALRMMSIRRCFSSRAGRPSLCVNNNSTAQKIICDERSKTQQSGRRKATGVRDQASVSNAFPICLGQTIDEF